MKRKTKNKLKRLSSKSISVAKKTGSIAKKIGTSLETRYKKRQEEYWKPENVKRRKIKAKARAEMAERIADNLDRMNEEALHGY